MEDALVFLDADAPCPDCGHALARTTVLCRDPACVDEILVEQPGLWCAACGAVARDAAVPAVAEPTRRAA